MVSGSWPGELYIFRGKDGGFGAAETIKDAAGVEIKLGQASALAAGDWDRDGDTDLVAGFISGVVVFLPNAGRKGAVAFDAPVTLHVDEKPIPSEHGGPALGDWDGDGDLDLVLGSGSGSVVLYRASYGENGGLPRLSAAETLVEARRGGDFKVDAQGEIIGGRSASRAKPALADWDGDGKVDLLVGDFATIASPEPVLTEEQKAEKSRLQAELNELNQANVIAFAARDKAARKAAGIPETGDIPKDKVEAWGQEIRKLMEKEEGATERSKKLGELRGRIGELSAKREMTGFVWLYQRR